VAVKKGLPGIEDDALVSVFIRAVQLNCVRVGESCPSGCQVSESPVQEDPKFIVRVAAVNILQDDVEDTSLRDIGCWSAFVVDDASGLVWVKIHLQIDRRNQVFRAVLDGSDGVSVVDGTPPLFHEKLEPACVETRGIATVWGNGSLSVHVVLEEIDPGYETDIFGRVGGVHVLLAIVS
jgi:hypothetical protein